MKNIVSYIALPLLLIYACSSGNTTTRDGQTVSVNTYNYNPGNKTAVNITIGGSAPIQAEVDTGSDMTVVNESAIGPNIVKTNESISITYGGGQNTVSGYLAYGSVTFTTSSGATLSSESNTPILVVTQGSVNEGGGNNAILGMRMNNQVSVRLYLPFPYNQMMILNRPLSQLTFGQLSPTQLNEFANIQEINTNCVNYQVPVTITNKCWNLAQNAVNYSVSGTNDSFNYETILDSGEENASFYFSPAPVWMNYNSDNIILNTITVTANTDKGLILLPLTPQVYYRDNPGNAVNPGNNLFNYYQILFDQADGIVGFKNYNNHL